MKVGVALRDEIDSAILALLSDRGKDLYRRLASDPLIMAWQDQANHVSIVRLGYNDHGPIHMRIVTLNSLKILGFLREGGIQPSIVFEKLGTFEDGQAIILLSAMLHDLGMAVARQRHEWHSLVIGMRVVERYLAEFYPDDIAKQVAITAMVQEGIVGHMGHEKIHSIEAGTVLVADGTDMTRGRARLAKLLSTKPTIGDMHRHSADAIREVVIEKGRDRCVHINVRMDDYSGIFQVEEVLMGKLSHSPIHDFVELSVSVRDEPLRRYL
jgi:metal-dependent HD superfamily phosphatase/phosphodiesterase